MRSIWFTTIVGGENKTNALDGKLLHTTKTASARILIVQRSILVLLSFICIREERAYFRSKRAGRESCVLGLAYRLSLFALAGSAVGSRRKDSKSSELFWWLPSDSNNQISRPDYVKVFACFLRIKLLLYSDLLKSIIYKLMHNLNKRDLSLAFSIGKNAYWLFDIRIFLSASILLFIVFV